MRKFSGTKTVRMRTTYAGPAGNCTSGNTIEVDAKEAALLIRGGYATEVSGRELAAFRPAERAVIPAAQPRVAAPVEPDEEIGEGDDG